MAKIQCTKQMVLYLNTLSSETGVVLSKESRAVDLAKEGKEMMRAAAGFTSANPANKHLTVTDALKRSWDAYRSRFLISETGFPHLLDEDKHPNFFSRHL